MSQLNFSDSEVNFELFFKSLNNLNANKNTLLDSQFSILDHNNSSFV